MCAETGMDSAIESVQEMDEADKQLVESMKPLSPISESGLKNLIHSLLDRPFMSRRKHI
jgi:hypothetical protein